MENYNTFHPQGLAMNLIFKFTRLYCFVVYFEAGFLDGNQQQIPHPLFLLDNFYAGTEPKTDTTPSSSPQLLLLRHGTTLDGLRLFPSARNT